MITASKKNKVMIQEATMMRFHPQTNYVKKLIQDNKIGKVHTGALVIQLEYLNHFPLLESMNHVPVWASLYCHVNTRFLAAITFIYSSEIIE